MNISLVTSLFPEVNPLTTNDVFPMHNWLLCLQKIIERSSIYKGLELCPRDLFSHTKKRLVGVDKNIAFSK